MTCNEQCELAVSQTAQVSSMSSEQHESEQSASE